MMIVRERISRAQLQTMARAMFGNMVKAVVDVGRRIMALDGELHSDEEALLLEDGSRQQDLWGINLYPDYRDEHWIEFDSVINIRPGLGNRSRGVDNEATRAAIIAIVNDLVTG
ncbi:MAG: DUF5674 family protein [candidate division WOR-3 bacterium]